MADASTTADLAATAADTAAAEADATRRRDADAAAALQSKRDAATAATAARRRLEEDVARHERALADARRRLREAATAEDVDAATDADADGTGVDATGVAALHAQALAILNVRALVPITLDLATASFSKWRRLLLLALGKYALADHVLCDATFPDVPHRVRMDLHVLSWVYGTISPELFEIITTANPSARAARLAPEERFVGNRETRVLLVDTEFRTLSRGTLSTLADTLVELGEPISDRLLVINVLRGLADRFAHLRPYIKRRRPPPSFAEVRSELQLEELSLGAPSASAPSIAAVPPAPTALAAGPPPSAPSSGGNRRRRKGKSGGGSTDGTAAPGAAPTGGGTWPSFFNPWTGTIQMWPGPRPPTAPTPRPQALLGGPVAPSAPTGGAAPPVYPAPAAPWPLAWPSPSGVSGPLWGGTPSPAPWAGSSPWAASPQAVPWASGGPVQAVPAGWDQQALAGAFNTMTLTPPPTGEWYMDSGATAHMASTSGPQDPARDPQVQ
ncbi:hypothetical protein U9M48_008389 [Paspalum notatum var. saurae]|uniref:Uncharacterized protein n=1 Tax=Paspalum notatum var. saurae TaxID=547442 RepID=A0AAQ3SNW3_PASNO